MPQLEIPAVEPADALLDLERLESSVSPAVLDRARKLLDALHRSDAPTPLIFATGIGGIQFEWHGGGFELDLEILPETEAVCVIFQDGRFYRKGEVRDEKELQTLIAWLRRNFALMPRTDGTYRRWTLTSSRLRRVTGMAVPVGRRKWWAGDARNKGSGKI